MKTNMKKCIAFLLAVCMLFTCTSTGISPVSEAVEAEAAVGAVSTSTINSNNLLDNLMNEYTSFILIKHRSLGGSHYAYTEGLSDELIDPGAPDGVEANFFPGSQMVLLELSKNGSKVTRKETVLLESPDGVLRDPDVSEDGTRVLFSWKKNSEDDYHLYEYDLKTKETKQLTFGSGTADFEPKYLPDGKIVFSSSRIIQTIDCWKTPVSNIYTCNADGSNITRLGYDQVHTTYPTVTADGRVLYTRWDYNDRNQMYVQGVFQMFPDGTNQTELYGNGCNFPTTLLHTRDIPGSSDKYISIASGHHTYQAGKLVVVDTAKGRNSEDAITFVVKDKYTTTEDSVDTYGQEGALYKYPYAVNENLFMTAYCESGWAGDKTYTPFGIYLFDMNGNKTELVAGDSKMPASQIVPVASRTMFERASMVNYTKETGTYYVADVYEGEGLEGVERGTAKYLRVVALGYRSYAIGATIGSGEGTSDPYSPISTGNGSWDVKRVLGVVPIEADGSALFTVPADTPIYFQVLDKDGYVMQSMRSWSTLMPGESFSCVGCHEDKNTVPKANATTTMAMAKGIQELQPDMWQTGEGYEDFDPYTTEKGFDYLEEIQPIWDESCVECHSDLETAYTAVSAAEMDGADTTIKSTPLAGDAEWKYTTQTQNGTSWTQENFDDSAWNEGAAPFGTATSGPGQIGTLWNSDRIYMRTEFVLTKYQYNTLGLTMNLACIDSPQIYVNGKLVYQSSGSISSYTAIAVKNEIKNAMKVGHNTIAITASKSSGGNFVGISIEAGMDGADSMEEVIPIGSQWKYRMSKSNDAPSGWNNVNYNDSGWKSATAPFGDREGYVTPWNGDNKYIWVRKTFTINNPADYAGCTLKLNTFYDDNPKFYLNGHLIYEDKEGDAWVDGYTNITLGADLSKYLVEGTNVLAIECSNDLGGRQIDCGLSIRKVQLSETEFVSTNSDWKYRMSKSNDVASGWNTANFNDSSWNTGKAPFGDREGYATSWNGDNKYIWLRKTFNIDDLSDFSDYTIKLNTFYDDNPKFYLNGNLIYTDTEGNPWVDGYTSIKLNASYTKYLVEGTNVLAIECSNDTGGRQIDTSFALVEGAGTSVELLATRSSGWKYVINSKPADNWMNENFNDSSWKTGNAPFGSESSCQTSWTGNNSDIWLRKTFTVNDVNAIKDMKMYLNIFYDEDPTVYINGTQVYTAKGYLTDYKLAGISTAYTSLLKQGTNTIAVHAHNSTGGLYIDTGLNMQTVSDIPFSLEATNVFGNRMKKYFPISYLYLTGSYASNPNWIANSTNEYTNWISSMSQCEVLDPYQYGAANSALIKKLRSGHGNLTEQEIRKVAAWIDLGVPAYGTYDANNAWDGNAVRWAEQYTNKRAFFDTMDEYAKASRAGVIAENPITISYDAKSGNDYTITQSGLATLYVGKSYAAGDKVTVTLPAGEKYVMLCMNSMMGEELIYVPNGVFTYTIPSANNMYPNTWKDAATNTITARLPKESELTEQRNLAQNIYDLDDASNSYPHATAKSAYGDQAEFQERNAIDGFTANTGHGNYPYQSWGPKNDDGIQWIQVDFGREVYANEVEIYIRADFPHDTHYISATLEFSDGTQKDIIMKKTKEAQVFTFDTVKTSYVKVKDLVPSDPSTNLWAGITELRVNGTAEEPKEPVIPEDPALTEAKAALDRAKADSKSTFEAGQQNYTEESWITFVNAYNAAVNADANADAATLNSLAAKLADAKGKLTEKPSETNKPGESETQVIPVVPPSTESESGNNGESETKPGGDTSETPTDSNKGDTDKPEETLTPDENKLVSALGVSAATAQKISELAKQYKVSLNTLLINDASLKSANTDFDVKGSSSFAVFQARAAKETKKSVKLKWNKIKGADGYLIYANKCGKNNKVQLTAEVKNKTSYTHKSLKKGTYYKYIVLAYKVVDGTKVTMAASKTIHAATKGGKYGNATSLKAKSKVRLKRKASVKLKVTQKSSKKVKKHRKISYVSTNTAIATVNSKGKIKAVGKGNCYVYAYAQNGVYKKVKVTVK